MNIFQNKPERVFGLQVQCRELDIFKKIWEFCVKFLWIICEFTFSKSAEFLNSKSQLITKGYVFEYGMNWFVCQEFGFCQDFVWMEKEEGQEI